MSSFPPGLPVNFAEVATQGGNDDWYSYEGEIKFENVMVVDEDNNKVLLGLKKEGFGAGNYNPFAGPINDDEDGSAAAQRDLLEQTGLQADNVQFKGIIRVVLPELGGRSLHCSMYKVTKWKGELKETETMIPEWFTPEQIPYAKMFDDDIHWMPLFLQQSKQFAGRVDFAKAEKGQDPSTSSLALGLLSSSALTRAIRLPIQRRATSNHKANISGFSSTPFSSSSLASSGNGKANKSDIVNWDNMLYTTNLTIGGTEVPVQLDTGSTDLWVDPSALPGIFRNVHNFTDVPVGVHYGTGAVEGFLAVTNVSFAGFDVDDQAFISVTNATDMYGLYGIIGFGFDSLCRMCEAVQNQYNATWGRSLLSNLFLQEPNTPNHIAFALERADDLDDMAVGSFDVGEIQPQYAAIEQSAPIPLWPETANRWTVLLDAITVNGSNVPLNSTFEGDNASEPPAGKSVALLDTGTSYTLAPMWAVEAIYGNIPGSVYSKKYGVWFIPCMWEGSVSLTIGATKLPVHPLDLSRPIVWDYSGKNETYCINTFAPLGDAPTPFDFVLGDSFLRNVYAIYDFGDFDTSGNMGKPYVKLLPLTDPTAASAGFKKNRAATLAQLPSEGSIESFGGVSTPNSVANSSLSGGSGANNLASAGSSDDDASINETLNKLVKYAPIALALLGVNVVLLIGVIAMGACAMAKRNKTKATGAGSGARGVYAPVTKFPEDDERARTPTGRYDVPQYS
ncbi:hypothetical protein FRC07_005650 [Ceratobasidium sp. 392]|nr:hypothetical protein FRC07_005650 [Ceratobasidium sp. 392]